MIRRIFYNLVPSYCLQSLNASFAVHRMVNFFRLMCLPPKSFHRFDHWRKNDMKQSHKCQTASTVKLLRKFIQFEENLWNILIYNFIFSRSVFLCRVHGDIYARSMIPQKAQFAALKVSRYFLPWGQRNSLKLPLDYRTPVSAAMHMRRDFI